MSTSECEVPIQPALKIQIQIQLLPDSTTDIQDPLDPSNQPPHYSAHSSQRHYQTNTSAPNSRHNFRSSSLSSSVNSGKPLGAYHTPSPGCTGIISPNLFNVYAGSVASAKYLIPNGSRRRRNSWMCQLYFPSDWRGIPNGEAFEWGWMFRPVMRCGLVGIGVMQ